MVRPVFHCQRFFASDKISGRARAFCSLVNAGMDVERAARISGVLVGDDDAQL